MRGGLESVVYVVIRLHIFLARVFNHTSVRSTKPDAFRTSVRGFRDAYLKLYYNTIFKSRRNQDGCVLRKTEIPHASVSQQDDFL